MDRSGKFLYVRDADDGDGLVALAGSRAGRPSTATPAATASATRSSRRAFHGLEARWTLFCDAEATVELWRVELARRARAAPRRLDLVGFLEWSCGVSPSPRREFPQLFLETWHDAALRRRLRRATTCGTCRRRAGATGTRASRTSAPSRRRSRSTAARRATRPSSSDATATATTPAALRQHDWTPLFGRHDDPIAALRCRVELPARRHARRSASSSRPRGSAEEAADLAAALRRASAAMDASLAAVRAGWRERLAGAPHRDPRRRARRARQRLAALPGHLGAALGRARLLPAERRLRLPRPAPGLAGLADHRPAALPRADPPPRGAPVRRRLGLPLVAPAHRAGPRHADDRRPALARLRRGANYIKRDRRLLHPRRRAPFLDDAEPAPLAEHVAARVRGASSQRTSPRGLPYIGAGDWNDGLSALGLEERGESVWLAQFLAGLLADWCEDLVARRRASGLSREFAGRREELVARDQRATAGTAPGTGARTLRRRRAGSAAADEPGRPDLPQRADLGDPQRRRAAGARRGLPRRRARAPGDRSRRPPARARLRRSRTRRSATSPATRRGCARTAASTPTPRPGPSPPPRR